MLVAPKQWWSPEELVEIGFARSLVVMMNELHNGLQRSVRTRVLGKRVLPTRRGGSAGFVVEDSSSSWFGVDAVILSVDNELT